MKKTIKLCDGFTITYDGESFDVETWREVLEAIHWDDTRDPATKEASEILAREMFCFGYVDLTPCMPEGHTLTVKAIPVREATK